MASRIAAQFEQLLSQHESQPDDYWTLALVKGSETYVFVYRDCTRREMLREFGRMAQCSELSFTWYDAAVLSQKLRSQTNPS